MDGKSILQSSVAIWGRCIQPVKMTWNKRAEILFIEEIFRPATLPLAGVSRGKCLLSDSGATQSNFK